MKCERCDNVALEHVAIRENGKIRELHLCHGCASTEAGITEPRERARLNRPQQRPTNVHDFLRHWEALSKSLGREPSKKELIQLLDRLFDMNGAE
jgi:protein-arginine kinase activator protein McsA